jgi:hypothetical protein
MQPPQDLPESLSRSFAVAEFRHTMRGKKIILEPLFAHMQLVGAEYLAEGGHSIMDRNAST